MRFLPTQLWHRIVGASILLLCLAQSRADASCGDYVRIAGGIRTAETHDGGGPAKPPCHGPSCTPASPERLPVSIPASPNLKSTPDAIVPMTIGIEAQLSSPLFETAVRPLCGSSEPIFHPPR